MAQKISGFIKLHVPAGGALATTTVGPALGLRGLNILEFCRLFNQQTQHLKPGLSISVVITRFADKSFSFAMTI